LYSRPTARRPISLPSSRRIGPHAAISIRNAHRMTDHSFGGSSRHLLTYRRRRNASGELSAVQKRNKTAPTRADRNDRKLPRRSIAKLFRNQRTTRINFSSPRNVETRLEWRRKRKGGGGRGRRIRAKWQVARAGCKVRKRGDA